MRVRLRVRVSLGRDEHFVLLREAWFVHELPRNRVLCAMVQVVQVRQVRQSVDVRFVQGLPR